MDGEERAPVGRSDAGVMTGWTGRKPWEIAWGESGEKERYRSDDKVDGGQSVGNSLWRLGWGASTVGNSLGRAPWGRSEMEATRCGRRGNRGK